MQTPSCPKSTYGTHVIPANAGIQVSEPARLRSVEVPGFRVMSTKKPVDKPGMTGWWTFQTMARFHPPGREPLVCTATLKHKISWMWQKCKPGNEGCLLFWPFIQFLISNFQFRHPIFSFNVRISTRKHTPFSKKV
jgi:hypothetical protein